jgi:hypothetical protein
MEVHLQVGHAICDPKIRNILSAPQGSLHKGSQKASVPLLNMAVLLSWQSVAVRIASCRGFLVSTDRVIFGVDSKYGYPRGEQ